MNGTGYSGRMEGMDIAFHYAVTTACANEAVVRHDCDPVAAHLLVRAMTAGLLAAASGAESDRLNVRWAYAGAVQAVVVDAGADGTVRALINPSQLAHAESVEALYGDRGEIRVVRSRNGTVTASGTVEACFMDVVDDLTAFLCMSDQVESGGAVLVALSDDPSHPVRMARGLLLHALPGCDLDRFHRIRERLHQDAARALMGRVTETDKLIEDLLIALAEGEELSPRCHISAAREPVFHCPCGPEKLAVALRALSYADRMDIVEKKEDVKIRCHFCNTEHLVTVEQCREAWNAKTE